MLPSPWFQPLHLSFGDFQDKIATNAYDYHFTVKIVSFF